MWIRTPAPSLNASIELSPDRDQRMMDRPMQRYGELAVKVGLNLRAGQRLLIIGPLASGGSMHPFAETSAGLSK